MKRYVPIFLITALLFVSAVTNAQPSANVFVKPYDDTLGFDQSKPDRSIHLTGDTASLRFTVYKYFPFIETTINGVTGKLLFDTGAQSSMEIDDKLVALKNPRVIGRGFVGSGQSFNTSKYDSVEHISLDHGKLSFTNAGPAIGHNLSYMNQITSDIIGLVGYRFFEGYLFKLDYKNGVIYFYKNTAEREQSKDFLKGEKVIGVLDFETRKLPNHPVIPMVIGKDTLALSFDTGQLGTLSLTEQAKKDWVNRGYLIAPDGSTRVEMPSFELPGGLKVVPGNTEMFPAQRVAPANKSIGITEKNSMTFGYGFLSQYKTVWDYGNHKIYLLER